MQIADAFATVFLRKRTAWLSCTVNPLQAL
jgi:hypothetical protein